ncbi:MAG: hypothetical protein ACRCT8_02600 [Lacipirellulaceae bacterium]
MQVEISEDTYRAVAATERDVSAFVERAVKKELQGRAAPMTGAGPNGARPRSFYEAAVASGLIGGGSDYPADLSSNPKHMEGFGE